MGVVFRVWTKRPSIGLKCPPLGILSRHIDINPNNILNYSNVIYNLTGLVSDRMPSLGQPLLPSRGVGWGVGVGGGAGHSQRGQQKGRVCHTG